MNEKLASVLLKLAENPSHLPEVKKELTAISRDELNKFESWEREFCTRIQRRVTPTLSDFFQDFFQSASNCSIEEKKQLTDTILKPIFLAVTKLPSAQRPNDFYQTILTATYHFIWQKREGVFTSEWLSNMILWDLPNDLNLQTILSQASDEEFRLLYGEIKIFFGEEGFKLYLSELDSHVLSLFLKRLSFNEITTLKLAELADQSPSVCQAIGDWLGTVPPSHQEVWQWVQEQKLLSIPGVICALPIEIEHKLNIPAENRDTDREEGLYEFCQLFIENQETGLATRSITEQMLSFAVLMFYVAERRTKFQNDPNYYGAARQKTDMAEELLERYKTATPFLRAFADAGRIPETLIPLLAVLIGVEDNHFNGYLLIVDTPLPPVKPSDSNLTLIASIHAKNPFENAFDIQDTSSFDGQSENFPTEITNLTPSSTGVSPKQAYTVKPANAAVVMGLLGLAIALALCFSPLAAPFWLIPVLVIGGAVVGGAAALIMNDRSRHPFAQSPIHEQEDGRSADLPGIPEEIPGNSNLKIDPLFQPGDSTVPYEPNTQSYTPTTT